MANNYIVNKITDAFQREIRTIERSHRAEVIKLKNQIKELKSQKDLRQYC